MFICWACALTTLKRFPTEMNTAFFLICAHYLIRLLITTAMITGSTKLTVAHLCTAMVSEKWSTAMTVVLYIQPVSHRNRAQLRPQSNVHSHTLTGSQVLFYFEELGRRVRKIISLYSMEGLLWCQCLHRAFRRGIWPNRASTTLTLGYTFCMDGRTGF